MPVEALCRCGAGPVSPFLGGFLPAGTFEVPGASQQNPDFIIAGLRVRSVSESNAWNLHLDWRPFVDVARAGELHRLIFSFALLLRRGILQHSFGNSGGVTSLVEAGFSGMTPAAFRYSKKERITESLKQTVGARFLL